MLRSRMMIGASIVFATQKLLLADVTIDQTGFDRSLTAVANNQDFQFDQGPTIGTWAEKGIQASNADQNFGGAFAGSGQGTSLTGGSLLTNTDIFLRGSASAISDLAVGINVTGTYRYEIAVQTSAGASFEGQLAAHHDGTDHSGTTAQFDFAGPGVSVNVLSAVGAFNNDPVFVPDLGIWRTTAGAQSPALRFIGGLPAGAYTMNAIVNTTSAGGGPSTTEGRVYGNGAVNYSNSFIEGSFIPLDSETTLGGLEVPSGFTAGFGSSLAGSSQTITTGKLNVTGTGQLDIADNRFVVGYTGSSPLGIPTSTNSIAGRVASGYNLGAWNGAGIVTSENSGSLGIGYSEASDVFSTYPATFGGAAVDSTSVLLRLTIRGDSDLDGDVDIGDYSRLASHMNQTGMGWYQGDFNYDGVVTVADFAILSGNYNQNLNDGYRGAPIPEAGIGGALGISGLLTKRRRKI